MLPLAEAAAHRILTHLLAILWIFGRSATGVEPIGLLSLPSPGQSIDILGELGVYNSSWVGVSLTSGPQQYRTAYYLHGDKRYLKLPSAAFERVSQVLRANADFSISAWLRQDEGNVGTIVSLSSGSTKYLEVQSSGRRNEVRFFYVSRLDERVHTQTFPYRLADNTWHHLLVSVSGSQVELLVDCHPLYKRYLNPGRLDRNYTELWLGQRYTDQFHFKGAMQDVRLIGGPHSYLSACPSLDSTCPTCGQFTLLQTTIQELSVHLQDLSHRLLLAESRLDKVEECDCLKSCRVNGTVHADGSTWQRGCDMCECMHGEVQCGPAECPKPNCKHPVKKQGECCETCLAECRFQSQEYEHGEVLTVQKCHDCVCNNGTMECRPVDPASCPPLSCPKEEQFSVPDSCCKFCPDIDECAREGGHDGHHCHANTRCVNTRGGYECECLPGYRRMDRYNCVENDECYTGEHECHPDAECVNTMGSYQCICKKGYAGDGYNCQPICNQSCLNGGVCRAPGRCSCPNGYTGTNCERDLDECATGLHRCTNTSECVNMIGWYYCRCRDGFEGPLDDNNLGMLCRDVNECDNDQHTCHPSADCVNTQGGFRCECSPEKPTCTLSCTYEGRDVADGMTVPAAGDPCSTCTCDRGVMRCAQPQCDCSTPAARRDPCCPQCDDRFSCRHQELSDVILSHGERWSYQCQTCECLLGVVDCWELKCPPLLCGNPVHTPGDCCPHCEDLCSMKTTGDNSSARWGQPCVLSGRIYDSGSQFSDPNDTCVACNCKDGVLCCSYNYHCNNDTNPVGFDGVAASSTTEGATSAPSAATDSVLPVVTRQTSDVTERFSVSLKMVGRVVGKNPPVAGKKVDVEPPGD